MVKLNGSFSQLKQCKILVVGDLMLDTYTIGKAKRISPEAPVAVIQVVSEEKRPGGSGNVALNLKSLGADVTILGRIGPDLSGSLISSILKEEKIDVRGLFIQKESITPIKNRIIAENQQIVRVDHEQITPLSSSLEKEIIKSIPDLMEGVAAVAISDYGKGFLTDSLLKIIIETANAKNIPVITDPKGLNFSKYNGTTLIKPNLSEAFAAAGCALDTDLDVVAEKSLHRANAKMLMITRSEHGISLFLRNGKRTDFPVHVREIKDVTGAGDTVLAMLTIAMANGLDMDECAQLANIAAGMAIEKFGCARISFSELADRLLEINVTNKIFDSDHLLVLGHALVNKRYILLSVDGVSGMSSALFSAIHRLAQNKEKDLVVYLRDNQPEGEFIDLLASIKDIKFIIVQSKDLIDLCKIISPEECYTIVGNKCFPLDNIESLFNHLSNT